MQDMSFPRIQFYYFFFSGEHAPKPYTCFSSDTSAVQLQKTPYLDKMNDETEKQWSNIYIILYENKSLNTKETTQNKTKAAVRRATKNVQLVLQHCCRNSNVARFTTHVRPCLARNKVVRFVFVGGKTRQHHYSTHFAAMWQNKLRAFCCPFYRFLGSQWEYH